MTTYTTLDRVVSATHPLAGAQALAFEIAQDIYGPMAEAPERYIYIRPEGDTWNVRASVGPIVNGSLQAATLWFEMKEVVL